MTVSNSNFYLDLLKVFSPQAAGATIYAESFNTVTDEVEAIETVLGTELRSRSLVTWAPSASTWNTLKERVDNMDAGIRSTSADIHPQYALVSAAVFQPVDGSSVALTIRGAVGNPASLFRVVASDGSTVAEFSNALIQWDRPTYLDGALTITTSSAAGLTLRVDSGYTDAVLRVTSSDVEVASLDGAGALTVSSVATDSLSANDFTDAQHDHSSESQGGRVLPAGMVTAFAGTNPPPGWLLANGATVSRALYPDLFTAIGVLHGPGDGSTTFTLPDLQQRFPMGASTSAVPASTGGSPNHTLAVANLPSHAHVMDHTHAAVLSSVQDTDHNHRLATTSYYLRHTDTGGTTLGDGGNVAERITADTGALTGTASTAHAHLVQVPGFAGSTSSVGSGTAVAHVPPYLALNYIVKT